MKPNMVSSEIFTPMMTCDEFVVVLCLSLVFVPTELSFVVCSEWFIIRHPLKTAGCSLSVFDVNRLLTLKIL